MAEAVEQPQHMKVMVALDGSDGSFYALNWTLDHFFNLDIHQPGGSESRMITLVNVQRPFQPVAYAAGPAVMYPPTSVIESVKKAHEEKATEVLGRALQMCRDKKVKAETLILEGDPKDKICEVAKELHVDLLVVGSRGLGAVKRAFLGSASDYCAHHAQCPILIVKPPPNTKRP